jgi:hypothetical protein
MTQEEIKNRVKELNKIINEKIDPTSYILNKDVEDALKEISEIQASCAHPNLQNNKYCPDCGKRVDCTFNYEGPIICILDIENKESE